MNVPLVSKPEAVAFAIGLLTVLGTLLAQGWMHRQRRFLAAGTGIGAGLMFAAVSWGEARRRAVYRPFVRALEQPHPFINEALIRETMTVMQQPLPVATSQVQRDAEVIQVSGWLIKASERDLGLAVLDGIEEPLSMKGGNGDPARHINTCFRIHQTLTQWLGKEADWVVPLEAALSDQVIIAIGTITNRYEFQFGRGEQDSPTARFQPTCEWEWALQRQFDEAGRLTAIQIVGTRWGCVTPLFDASQASSPELGSSLKGRLVQENGQFKLTQLELRLYTGERKLLWGRRYDVQGNSTKL